jgi:hypothetical protein
MRGTALLQRAHAYRLRYNEAISVAEFVFPSLDVIITFIGEVLHRNVLSSKLVLEILRRTQQAFQQLEGSNLWNAEAKSRWLQLQEGMVVQSGDEILRQAIFLWSQYEHSLFCAGEDLLNATRLLPGFAHAWRRAADALGEMYLFSFAIEYCEIAMQLDSSLSDVLFPVIERMKGLNSNAFSS